jgi:hypothetical protein
LKLEGYADADYAGCPDSRKSTSGFLVTLGGSAISWKSQRQQSVSTSTAEAEYISLCAVMQHLKYLRQLVSELGCYYFDEIRVYEDDKEVVHSIDEPITVYEDNQPCIAIAKNPVLNQRAKHIDVKYHFVRECVKDDVFKLEYCPTQRMVADIFTKAVNPETFRRHRDNLRVIVSITEKKPKEVMH